jgi:hypothetical protein
MLLPDIIVFEVMHGDTKYVLNRLVVDKVSIRRCSVLRAQDTGTARKIRCLISASAALLWKNPQFHSKCPGDIVLHLVPGALSRPLSRLRIDITSIPPVVVPLHSSLQFFATTDDHFHPSVIQHHESFEKEVLWQHPLP